MVPQNLPGIGRYDDGRLLRLLHERLERPQIVRLTLDDAKPVLWKPGRTATRLTGRGNSSTITRVMAPRRSASLARWRGGAVRRMVTSRESTLAFIARLPEGEILRPRTQDRWSIKDVLAHLLSCDEETVRRLRLIEDGHGDRIHWFEDMADADRFNARSVARARRLGLRTVLRRMARIRADLITRLERLPTESLRDPSHAYTVVQWLPAPGWSHERDHLSEIRTWWRSRRAARPAQRPDRRAASTANQR